MSNFNIIASDVFDASLNQEFLDKNRQLCLLKINLVYYLDQLRQGLIEIKSMKERCDLTFNDFRNFLSTQADNDYLDSQLVLLKNSLNYLDFDSFLFELDNTCKYIKNIFYYLEANKNV